MSVGFTWASRITSLGLEFALPAWGGWWLDGRLGTRPWCLIAGTILGFGTGIVHLVGIARDAAKGGPGGPSRPA